MGFVKISDDLPSWAWYGDNTTLLVYIRLLLGAVWRETEYQNVTLQRGQIATTLPKIAKENGITERQARTILERLKSTGKVSVKITSKFRIITLNNYDCVSENVSQLDRQMSDKRQTTCQSNVRPTLLYTELQNTEEQKPRASGFNEIKRLFNEICVSLPPLEFDLTIQQVHLIQQAEINLRGSSFEDFFKRVERSDFLCGRTKDKFKANFNWILKPENMMKILSGNFDSTFKPSSPQNSLTQNSWSEMSDEEIEEQAAHFYD